MASEWAEVGDLWMEDETVVTVSRQGALARLNIATEDGESFVILDAEAREILQRLLTQAGEAPGA